MIYQPDENVISEPGYTISTERNRTMSSSRAVVFVEAVPVAIAASAALFVVLASVSAKGAETLQEKPTTTKQAISVEHIKIESTKSYAAVRAALERSVPPLDPGLVKALA